MESTERSIRNCPVAVIGSCGFLGSHLVNHLIDERGCEVLAIDNLISGSKKFLHPKAKFEYADITHSESQLRRLFETYKIEYVFNYAAEPYIPVSFERPVHVFDINARGALFVLNAAQEAGVKAILQVSSAEIYGDAPEHKINEEYPARPHSTYGASKLAIDTLIQARWKEAKTPAIALRQFNCVGERETHQYIIPEIIEQLYKQAENIGMTGGYAEFLKMNLGKRYLPDISLGNNSFRDFQYAGDAVRMATELLEKGQFGEVYNMGSEEGIKMYDLAERIAEIMGFEPRWKEMGFSIVKTDPARVRPWEIWHLQSDNTKLYSVIETRPQVSLDEALRRTVEDYKANGWCYAD